MSEKILVTLKIIELEQEIIRMNFERGETELCHSSTNHIDNAILDLKDLIYRTKILLEEAKNENP